SAVVAAMLPGAVRTAAHIPLARLTAGSGPVASVEVAVADQSLAPLSASLIRPELRRRPVLVGRRLSGIGPRSLASVSRRLAVRNVQAAGRGVLLVAVCDLASPLLCVAGVHGAGGGTGGGGLPRQSAAVRGELRRRQHLFTGSRPTVPARARSPAGRGCPGDGGPARLIA